MAAMLGSRLSAGCFVSRTAPMRHVAAVAPRVNGITPVALPSSSVLGGAQHAIRHVKPSYQHYRQLSFLEDASNNSVQEASCCCCAAAAQDHWQQGTIIAVLTRA
jgi:hypothetical protein